MKASLRLTLIASVVLSGCGGDDGGGTPIDAPRIDAAEVDADTTDAPDVDAAIDAPIDAPPGPPFTGTVTIIEGQVLVPSPGPVNTFAAQGIQLGIAFADTSLVVGPVIDTNPGTLFGCKVTELTAAQLAGAAGIDEGSVQITVANGGTPANPVYPACTFVAGGTGYICPDPSSGQAISAASSITLGPAGNGLTLLTVVAGTATFEANDVGRYVSFAATGTNVDGPHKALPIVSLGPSANQAVLGTTASITTTLTAGMLTTLAGAGPFPMQTDPGQLADTASVTAVLTPGGGNHFPMTTITYSNVGDDFSIDDTSAGILRNLPSDGSAFTVSCGGTCGGAFGTVLNITTTDTDVTGLSPFSMPPPTTKRVTIRCAEAGATSITVPAHVSARLVSSGATRIQASFIRGSFGASNPQNQGLTNVVAGHAIVGFTTR